MGFDFTSELLRKDAEFLKRAIGRCLHRLDLEKFPGQEPGYVVYVCSDGHQFRRMMREHWERCPQAQCDHPFADHGVALCVHPDSPIAMPGESALRLKHLADAFGMKQEVCVILQFQHWPCGGAVSGNLPVREQLKLLDATKDVMTKTLEKAGHAASSVFIGLHIDTQPLVADQGLFYFDRHDFRNFLMAEARERAYLVS